MLQKCFARLRCADLVVHVRDGTQLTAPFDFLADAPQLRKVDLDMPKHVLDHTLNLPVSWKLVHFGFASRRLDALHVLPTVAQYAATLQSLSCTANGRATTTVQVIQTIGMPALHRITLGSSAQVFIKFIDAPNLQEISLISNDLRRNPYAALQRFLSSPVAPVKSLHRLKILEVWRVFDEMASRQLLRCLKRMNGLRELEISTGYIGCDINAQEDLPVFVSPVLWDGLTVRDGKAPILPNLRFFKLSFDGLRLPREALEAQQQSLTPMLRSRETARVVEGRKVVALERVEIIDEEEPRKSTL